MPIDGLAAPDHVVLIGDLVPGGTFAILGVENLIADRVGQLASGTAPDRS